MAILGFKEYRLEYLQEGVGHYDENGIYHLGQDIWVSVGRCDAVPAGRNNIIQLPDGSTESFSFTIGNLNPRGREFKYGERIRLTVLGQEHINLTVKGFARYQHQCKIWA